MFVGVIAGGDHALRFPVENAEDSIEQSIEDLKKINFSSNDLLIGIAASGRTPYVLSSIKYAKSIGSKTASISTTKNSQMSTEVDYPIEIVVGAEVITGSTRMKSGTAQKLVLNMISTAVMIKLGKVYENLMIDVKTSNEKLRLRAIEIVREITNGSDEEIKTALENSGYSAKISVVMLWKGISSSEAKKLIDENDGVIGGLNNEK